MGWSGGTRIACDMIRSIEDNVDLQYTRVKIYKELIATLEDEDCDNLEECIGISDAFDEALEEYSPGRFDDDN